MATVQDIFGILSGHWFFPFQAFKPAIMARIFQSLGPLAYKFCLGPFLLWCMYIIEQTTKPAAFDHGNVGKAYPAIPCNACFKANQLYELQFHATCNAVLSMVRTYTFMFLCYND